LLLFVLRNGEQIHISYSSYKNDLPDVNSITTSICVIRSDNKNNGNQAKGLECAAAMASQACDSSSVVLLLFWRRILRESYSHWRCPVSFDFHHQSREITNAHYVHCPGEESLSVGFQAQQA
jgi:hypothetical protein